MPNPLPAAVLPFSSLEVRWFLDGEPQAHPELLHWFLHSWPVALDTDVQYVAVHKTRLFRHMQLNTFTGAADEVAAAAPIDRGLSVELARLVVADRSYTSLCFAAFPDDFGMDTAFNAVVNAFLADLDSPVLGAEQSSGYPGWLAMLPR